MEVLQVLGPLLGVVVGGVITGFGGLLKERRERKRLIAVALSDLLEVRHRMVSIDMALREIGSIAKIPEPAMPAVRTFFESLFPADPSLADRYAKGVNTLAALDPVLGFSLRSKSAIPSFLTSLRQKAIEIASASGAQAADLVGFETLERELRLLISPQLDDAVLELARKHSFLTLFKVKKLVANSTKPPEELKPLLDRIKQLASAGPTPPQ